MSKKSTTYTITPKFKKGDEIWFFNKGQGIMKITVSAIHAQLKEDGTCYVFYSSGQKKKYQRIEVVEEPLAFATPEEVAQKLVEDTIKASKEDPPK